MRLRLIQALFDGEKNVTELTALTGGTQANVSRHLQTLTQEWQESDGNPANLQQMRENLVGREAAERLAKLDQERAQWQQRVDSWLMERQAILSNSGISDADKERFVKPAMRGEDIWCQLFYQS